jgi:hypothetical protein
VLQPLLAWALLVTVPSLGQVPLAPGTPADTNRAAWIALKDSGFAVPPGGSPAAILEASEGLLGNRDPILRDDVAYGLAVAWIYRERRVPDEAIRAFATRLRERMRPGQPGDAALERSFSALVLSIVAAADLKSPILTADDRGALVRAAAIFLTDELDPRGYDPRVGWVHATAHAADLLKFLARSPQLSSSDQQLILRSLLARIDRPGPVFAWGEDDRIADALGALLVRRDVDPAPLDTWMAALAPATKAFWAAPVLDTNEYARLINATHVLRALYVSGAQTKDRPEPARAIEARILETLRELDSR